MAKEAADEDIVDEDDNEDVGSVSNEEESVWRGRPELEGKEPRRERAWYLYAVARASSLHVQVSDPQPYSVAYCSAGEHVPHTIG